MRICPRCTKILVDKTVAGVKVESCSECGGAWFDRGELNEIARSDVDALDALDQAFRRTERERSLPSRDLRCPVCLAILEEFEFKHFAGVSLDSCTKCRGIWVDDGELTAIAGKIRKRS